MGCLNVYVVVDPKGDRPYVATTMSEERLRLAEEKGWVVSLVKGSIGRDGTVGIVLEREVLTRAKP